MKQNKSTSQTEVKAGGKTSVFQEGILKQELNRPVWGAEAAHPTILEQHLRNHGPLYVFPLNLVRRASIDLTTSSNAPGCRVRAGQTSTVGWAHVGTYKQKRVLKSILNRTGSQCNQFKIRVMCCIFLKNIFAIKATQQHSALNLVL